MPIIKWRPFRDLDDMFDDFKQGNNGWDLAADVYENDQEVVVTMHTAGIDPDHIDIEVEDTHLHVSGTRKEEQESEDQEYYRKEIRRGSFERVIPLPCHVDGEEARAEMKDGVLKIMLPKHKAKEASNKIKIHKK